jgi:hypothetical protein
MRLMLVSDDDFLAMLRGAFPPLTPAQRKRHRDGTITVKSVTTGRSMFFPSYDIMADLGVQFGWDYRRMKSLLAALQ